MTSTFDYLIVGGGMAADAAARGIRERDDEGTIGIIGQDLDPPYTRPALTKRLWIDPDFTVEDNWLRTAEETGAQLSTSTTVTDLDVAEHTVSTGDGQQVRYQRLLLATGGRPKTLDIPAGDRSIYFRTFADYQRLRENCGHERHVAVVGGGFIGSELAAALVQNTTTTTLIYPDATLCGSIFPAPLAERFEQAYVHHGVHVQSSTTVTTGTADHDGVTVELDDGSLRRFDALVSGLGIEPAVELATGAGLEVDDGIVVDAQLRTSAEDVFAAGDVARYPDRILGRQRVEHVDNATQMGRTAGRIMAGSNESYDHTPYFYSNVFDMSYQAVGTLDASLRTVEDWAVPMEEGVVYYLSETRRVAGILLWNVTGQLEAARTTLAQDRPYETTELIGRITS